LAQRGTGVSHASAQSLGRVEQGAPATALASCPAHNRWYRTDGRVHGM